MIEAKADVNAEDVDNWTALLNAAQNGNLQIVEILVENDAQIDHCDCVKKTQTNEIRSKFQNSIEFFRDNLLR